MRLGGAREGAQCRGLAGAVAPEQGDALPFVHIEADVLDVVALAVASLEAPGREIGRLAGRARRQGRRLALACRAPRFAPPRSALRTHWSPLMSFLPPPALMPPGPPTLPPSALANTPT